tara:strand:+ start:90 stop:722 length:633 start_codon:yes stop_codon:yes gene_type:complete
MQRKGTVTQPVTTTTTRPKDFGASSKQDLPRLNNSRPQSPSHCLVCVLLTILCTFGVFYVGQFENPLSRDEAKYAWLLHPPSLDFHAVLPEETAEKIHLGKRYDCERPMLLGNHINGEGGWPICISEHIYKEIKHHMCVVYSVGLADDISFDLAVDALGCEVFAYDHTIGHLPPTIDTLTNNIKWTQWGVGVLPEPPNPQQKYIKVSFIS